MFKKRKLQLANRMNALSDAAQVTTAITLFQYFGVQQAGDEIERNRKAAKASAVANHLFGKSSDPIHTRGFDLPDLYAEGLEWLRQTPRFRELVVQSLRVRNMVEYVRTGKAMMIGESILAEFGHEYPEALPPASYAALVDQAIEGLSPNDQARIRGFCSGNL